MSNFLDLRNKGINKVKVIERVIFKPRSFKFEIIKMVTVIMIVTSIGFGITKADEIPVLNKLINGNQNTDELAKTFSTFGLVLDKDGSQMTIQRIYNSKLQSEEYTVETVGAKIQTNTYEDIAINDIAIGTKIIAKGMMYNNRISARTIFVFDYEPDLVLEVATTTDDMATTTEDMATTTDDIASTTDDVTGSDNTSTTTDDTASTTEETSTSTQTSTTTSGAVETVTNIVDSVVDTITNTVDNIIGAITGNSTSTPQTTEPEQPADEPAPAPVDEPQPETVEEPQSEPASEPEPADEPVEEPASEPASEAQQPETE